jgi:hypothetical protein
MMTADDLLNYALVIAFCLLVALIAFRILSAAVGYGPPIDIELPWKIVKSLFTRKTHDTASTDSRAVHVHVHVCHCPRCGACSVGVGGAGDPDGSQDGSQNGG